MQKGLDILVNQEDIVSLYLNYDILNNKSVALGLNGERISGTAQGINQQGCLIIKTQQTEKTICHSRARSSLQILC